MITRAIFWIYAALAALGFAAALAGTYGLFGAERDPLSVLWALVLGAPWSFLPLELVEQAPAWAKLAVLCLPLIVNGIVLLALGRFIRGRARGPGH